MASGLSPTTSTSQLKPALAEGAGAGDWGVRDSGAVEGALRPLAFCPFQDPRTPPGFAENPSVCVIRRAALRRNAFQRFPQA